MSAKLKITANHDITQYWCND